MKKTKEEITFKDILQIFVPKVWIIALVAIIFASAFAFYSEVVVEDSYTSYSVLSIRKDTEALQPQDITIADIFIEQVEYRVYNSDFLEIILNKVKSDYNEYDNLTISHIASFINYSPLGNGVLRISVTSNNPQLSFAVAGYLEDEIAILFQSELSNQLSVVPYISAKPSHLDSKGTVKNALIGFVVGTALSAVAVWIYSALDTSIKNKKKIEDNFDLPILGVIPAIKANTKEKEAQK